MYEIYCEKMKKAAKAASSIYVSEAKSMCEIIIIITNRHENDQLKMNRNIIMRSIM